MRRHRGIDKNQPEIVSALKAAGASVCDLSGAGEGVADILIGYQGTNYFAEIKRPWVKGMDRGDVSLSPVQAKFHAEWKGQIAVVTTPEEALALLTQREG